MCKLMSAKSLTSKEAVRGHSTAIHRARTRSCSPVALDAATAMKNAAGGKYAAAQATDVVFPAGKKRYVTALLCLWVTTICYADRTCCNLPHNAMQCC